MPDTNATSTTSTQGTPVVTSTSLTSTTVVPVANPLLEPKNYMELGGFLLMIVAVWTFIEKRADKRRKEDADFHKLAHDALNKELGEIVHDAKGLKQEIMAVAANRTSDVERIVKLEIGQQNIKEALGRVESNIEKNHKETLDQMKNWADQFSESIREVRKVTPNQP